MKNVTEQKLIPFFKPDIDENEIAAVKDVLESGWLSSGPKTKQFEEVFADFVGARYAVALNSCTAALHLALASLNIKAGEIMITSPYNFTAAAEVSQLLGLEPVFVDIEANTLNLDPEKLEQTIKKLHSKGKRVRVIIPMHITGHPCDLDDIDSVATKFGCVVIEDAAHAIPSKYKGYTIGSRRITGHPLAVCFSFYPNKTMTTGEGGMLVTDDKDVADRCRKLRLHGISQDIWSREQEKSKEVNSTCYYDVEEVGYKMNMNDIAAAIGISQLKKVNKMRESRYKIAMKYNIAFDSIPAFQIPIVEKDVETSWHLYILRLNLEFFRKRHSARDQFIKMLRRNNIVTSVHYRPLHLHSHYQRTFGYRSTDFPVSLSEYQRAVSLPIYSSMSDADVRTVIEVVCRCTYDSLLTL